MRKFLLALALAAFASPAFAIDTNVATTVTTATTSQIADTISDTVSDEARSGN